IYQMQLAGFIFAFLLALVLISKNINMGLSLLVAAFVAGIVSMDFVNLLEVMFQGIISPMSVELIIIVGLISGLGYLMKKTGDLDKMVQALNSLLGNTKLLLMFIPALIGTLNIPGGAILSAPMIEESGNRVNMNGVQKSSINLFFRHIGFFVYPLYPSMIIISELMEVPIPTIIKYTAPVTLAGLITAYLVLFKNCENHIIPKSRRKKVTTSLYNFLAGFSSVLVILILALALGLPFTYSVIAGTLVALLKKPESINKSKIEFYYQRVKEFVREGIDYQLVFTIIGLMAFKEVIEESGFVNQMAEIIIEYGIPLPLLIIIMGLIAGYVTGVHMAATGILAPIFVSIIPGGNIAVYTALLFVTINLGYLISPLHLCLALSNEFFKAKIGPVYKKLVIPILVMIIVSWVQLLLFA
ncbi:MAG: DUF401 family protein, partial [Bacillota bacterium]